MVDVLPGVAMDHSRGDATAVPGGYAVADPTADMTRCERARFERELAVLDLTDAAQASARSAPVGDRLHIAQSQLDLADALYASADRHRQLAERLDSEEVELDSSEHGL